VTCCEMVGSLIYRIVNQFWRRCLLGFMRYWRYLLCSFTCSALASAHPAKVITVVFLVCLQCAFYKCCIHHTSPKREVLIMHPYTTQRSVVEFVAVRQCCAVRQCYIDCCAVRQCYMSFFFVFFFRYLHSLLFSL
jgi:hypothetical protein